MDRLFRLCLFQNKGFANYDRQHQQIRIRSPFQKRNLKVLDFELQQVLVLEKISRKLEYLQSFQFFILQPSFTHLSILNYN